MENPKGTYSNVCVRVVSGRGQDVRGINGSYVNDVFVCGPFPWHERPEFGDYCVITGTRDGRQYEFRGLRCTHGARTSQFRQRRA